MNRRLRLAASITGAAAVGSLATVAVGRALWRRDTRRLVSRLDNASAVSARYDIFTEDQLIGLPPPVTRFFQSGLEPGQPLIRSAVIATRGDFLMKPGRWSRFEAEQHFTVSPPGFVWDASIRMLPAIPVRVRDSYLAGVGRMRARVAGLVPVVDRQGSREMAEASLQRYLAEAVWLPTALLPSAGVAWSPLDDTSARATLEDHGVRASVDFRFDASGLIVGVAADRFRDVDGQPVLTPWRVDLGDYARTYGVMVPRAGEVAWLTQDGASPFWRGHISRLAYRFGT